MNRKTILALVLASAFALSTTGSYAQSDEEKKDEKKPEQTQLIVAQSDEEKKDEKKPELIAQSDEEKKDEEARADRRKERIPVSVRGRIRAGGLRPLQRDPGEPGAGDRKSSAPVLLCRGRSPRGSQMMVTRANFRLPT